MDDFLRYSRFAVWLTLSILLGNPPLGAQSLEIHEWVIEFRGDKPPSTNEVRAGEETYTLRNMTMPEQQLVGYGQREEVVDLIWNPPLSPDSGNIRFARQLPGSIVKGEVVAVHVEGGGYLYYKKRPKGINLDYSKDSRFEWVICGGEPEGINEHLHLRERVGLFNMIEKDFLIYCPREHGINLRWARDCLETLKSK